MDPIVIRIVAIVIIVGGVWWFYKFVTYNLAKPKNACPRCDGKGYWEGVRNKEKCKQCNGTGVYIK